MSRWRTTLRRLPLRTRLVAGFVAAMLVVLVGAGAFVYWRVASTLDGALDSELSQATSTIRPLLHGEAVTDVPRAEATGTGWQVVSGTGAVLSRGGSAPTDPLLSRRQLSRSGGAHVLDVGDILDSGHTYRVQVTRLDRAGPAAYLVVEARRDRDDETLRELLGQLALAGLGALVVTSVVGDLLARSALRPVERYRRRAEEIASGARALRLEVPDGRDDEVTRLGHTLNDMLAVLEEAVERERRFVNDASHELRTPLTLLKSRVQLARRRARSVEEHERILDELAIDVGRLASLAEELLALGGASGASGDTGPVDLVRVTSAVVDQRRLADPEHASRLRLVVPAGRVLAAVGAIAAERLVTNLVQNALLHGAPPVTVTVTGPVDGWVSVAVDDAGPGMPPELLTRATARFMRADEARSRPGSGLGLALVEQLALSAGGQLRLCSGGEHARFGAVVPLECVHGPEMVATIYLPAGG